MFLQIQFRRKKGDGNAVSLILSGGQRKYSVAKYVRFERGQSFILIDCAVFVNKYKASYVFMKKVDDLQYDPEWVIQPNENLIAEPPTTSTL